MFAPQSAARMLLLFLSLISIATTAATAGGGKCVTDLECALNGECVAATKTCVCDSAWKGANCAVLALQPAPATAALRQPNVSTWGMQTVYMGGKFHGFFAEMEEHCGLTSWETNSLIAHAVADTPNGPWKRVGVTSGVWSHNPATTVAPDGTILLFHIGSGSGGVPLNGSREYSAKCHNGYSPCGTHPSHHCNASSSSPSSPSSSSPSSSSSSSSSSQSNQPPPSSHGSDSTAPSIESQSKSAQHRSTSHSTITFFTSKTPQGPWTISTATINGDVGTNNPTPWTHPNGSIYIVFNSNNMTMVRADRWQGPYDVVTHGACGHGEDPFLYTDRKNRFHCLYHRAADSNGFANLSIAGGHAYSEDGITWHADATPAYSTTVEYEDSPTVAYGKRERPHLIFDPISNEPTHLCTGVCLNDNWTLCNNNPYPGYYDYTFTSIQPINHQ